MSSGDEAGPSRRSGRRTARVRYDIFPEIEGLEDEPPRLIMSEGSSDSDHAPSKKGKGKGRAKGTVNSSRRKQGRGSEDSEFDQDEEDLELDYGSNGTGSLGTPDEDEWAEVQPHKTLRSRRTKSNYEGAKPTITPGDEHDRPNDPMILDFNAIYDPGHTLALRYASRRDVPKMKHGSRRNQLPVRPFGLTRLKADPHLGKLSEIEVSEGTGMNEKDALKLFLETLHGVPYEIPPELWAGEGWWPECWTYKDGLPQWTARHDVDLGLLEVGLRTQEQVRYLNADEAKSYLSERMGDAVVNLHLGVDNEAQGMKAERVRSKVFDTFKLGGTTQKQAQLFDAGGYVSCMDWCPMSEEESSKRGFKQYIAVSTLDPATQPNRTGGLLPDLKGSVQIWSIEPDKGVNDTGLPEKLFEPGYDVKMRCASVLCFDGGSVISFKWMPLGCCDPAEAKSNTIRKIGIIAAVLTDGSTRFFSVPDPSELEDNSNLDDPVFVAVEPILELRIDEAAATTLDWGSAGRLAIGYSNGSIGVWDNVLELLRGEDTMSEGNPISSGFDFRLKQQQTAIPGDIVTAHSAAVKTIQWVRLPPDDTQHNTRLDLEPDYMLTLGWDGNLNLIDIRDSTLLNDLDTTIRYHASLAWDRFGDNVLWVDHEYYATQLKFRRYFQFASIRTSGHAGPILCQNTSDYHGMLATSGTDGSIKLVNTIQLTWRNRMKPLCADVYQLDYNRNTKEYRMIDRIQPKHLELSQKLVNARHNSRVKDAKAASAGWPPEISITCLEWNNAGGIGRAGQFASGSASGLCRIDFLKGYANPVSLAAIRARQAAADKRDAIAAKKGRAVDASESEADDF